MSKISLEGNALGTGTFTITSPNSNTSRTLTLPDASGSVVITGGAQTIEFGAGTVSAPAITTTNDTNTGIYFPAADTIAFTEGGVEAMRINSDTNVLIGAQTGFSGGTRFHVQSASDKRTADFYRDDTIASGSEIVRFIASDGGGTVVGNVTTSGIIGVRGVAFPATQVASTDANTLDDYEEGTWTPTLEGSSSNPTVTYTTRLGVYTKVGRMVTVCTNILPATYSGGGGTLYITGLPFQSANLSTGVHTGAIYLNGTDIGVSRTWATAYIPPNVSYVRILGSQNNGAATDINVGDVAANDNIIFSITYFV
jgi:hypothetical protein